MKLFVYGTLQDKDAMEELIERNLAEKPEPAALEGYERQETSYGYPIIVQNERSIVKGLLWRELTDEDFIKLDNYEDCDGDPPLYDRLEVKVKVGETLVQAYVYVGAAEYWNEHQELINPL